MTVLDIMFAGTVLGRPDRAAADRGVNPPTLALWPDC